jgi:segregation and condensation protein A
MLVDLKYYQVDLPEFSGPLDLLLHLIERDELDVTAISLVAVTDQYLEHLDRLDRDRVEHMADFLVVAARLLVIKSRALLPQPEGLYGDEEEEDPAEALARQLRRYKRFREAAAWLDRRQQAGLRTHVRVAPPPHLEATLDLDGVTILTLTQALHGALERNIHLEDEVASVVERRTLTIETQIDSLRRHLGLMGRVLFDQLLSDERSKAEVSVTLLAVLELVKRREVQAEQELLFGPIEIAKLKAP